MTALRGWILATMLSLTGCTGFITEPGDDQGSSGPNGESGLLDVAPSPLRRMTPDQYQNTVRDLFQMPALELQLDPDTGEAVTRLAAEKLNAAAEQTCESQASWGDPVFPCDTSGQGSAECVDEFIDDFGKRAFRRPVSDAERAWLRGVYDKARAQGTFRDALFVVLKVMLQAPQFLYFLELGAEPKSGLAVGVRPLTGFERATRLAYFLWNTTPDTALLTAAESGALDTSAGVRSEAERLLADPRARTGVVRFFVDWLELDGTTTHHSLDSAQKLGFAEDSPALRAAMRKEIEALVERVVLDGDGRLSTLLTTREAWVDGPLAALYGVSGVSGSGAQWVELPEAERSGLFTRAAFTTLYAGPEVKSPIRRGAFLLEHVLCVELGDPPPNANDTPVTGGAVEENGQTVHKTVRQDVDAKTSGDGCTGCHSVINPIGFTFENYDALGRWHGEETGEDESGPYALPVDASGGLPLVEDGAATGELLPIDGALELSAALAESRAVQACFAERWFSRAVGRKPGDQDAKTLQALTAKLAESDDIRALVLSLVTSDAFLHVRRPED